MSDKAGEAMAFKVRVEATVNKEFVHCVFTTAIEGGIGYWASVSKYKWSKAVVDGQDEDAEQTADYDNFEAVIKDEDSGKRHTINARVIQKAITLICGTKEMPYAGSQWRARMRQAIATNDAGDVDAGDADNIIQIGLFGKIVYG